MAIPVHAYRLDGLKAGIQRDEGYWNEFIQLRLDCRDGMEIRSLTVPRLLVCCVRKADMAGSRAITTGCSAEPLVVCCSIDGRERRNVFSDGTDSHHISMKTRFI